MPCVSVIIPFFNVEDYIDQCIKSVINQTFRDIEIIAINDGSTDGSLQIIQGYAENDCRIRVIEQKNSGVSVARNRGINVAEGEYVWFVDSDDWACKDFIEKMYKVGKQENAEIVVCNLYRVSEKGTRVGRSLKTGCFNSDEMIKMFFKRSNFSVSVWNKLFKRELFSKNQIEFPAGIIHEDMAILFPLLFFANKTCIINNPLYYYRKRTGSLGINPSPQRFFDFFPAMERIKSFLINYNIYIKYKSEYEYLLLRFYVRSVREIHRKYPNLISSIPEIKSKIPYINDVNGKVPSEVRKLLPIHYRLGLYLILNNPSLYKFLVHYGLI